MENEAKCRYGDVFTLAERKFFKHRLVTLHPKISDEGMEDFHHLFRTTEASQLPMLCFIQNREDLAGIVFRGQSDKISCDCNKILEIEDDVTDEDEDFISAEADESIVTPLFSDDLAIPNDEASGGVTENNLLSSADFSDKDKANPEESVSPCDSTLHSRDDKTIHSKDLRNEQKERNDTNKDEPSPMEFDDSNQAGDENNKPDDKTEGKPRRRSRGHCYNPYYTTKETKARPTTINISSPIHMTLECCKMMKKVNPLNASVPEVNAFFPNAHGTIQTLSTFLRMTMIFSK